MIRYEHEVSYVLYVNESKGLEKVRFIFCYLLLNIHICTFNNDLPRSTFIITSYIQSNQARNVINNDSPIISVTQKRFFFCSFAKPIPCSFHI